MKAKNNLEVKRFRDIPNVGPRMEDDFRILGIKKPSDLAAQDPLKMYQKMSKLTNSRQDPCVLGTYLAVVDFMNGAKSIPWWHYTK